MINLGKRFRMDASNTAPTSALNNDTYRSNDPPQKSDLRIRLAAECTGEGNDGSEGDATNNAFDSSEYRLTSQLGRKLLERSHVVPSVIDDIKQRFSGVVADIDYESEEFVARISDLTASDNPDELVTLSFDEIQESDLRQLTKGDSFVWYIGYIQGQLISREGFSKIRFRRLPAWSHREIDAASSRTEELTHFFRPDPDTST